MLDFDAFSGGIEPGGLRIRNEIRILICYLLNTVGEPMSKDQLATCLAGEGIVNYFEVIDAVDSLVTNGTITEVAYCDAECYTVTESGKTVASALSLELTRSLREKASSAALKQLSRARTERENTVTIEKREGGYFVTFVMYGFSEEIMKLTLFAADSEQAQLLKEGFLKDPVSFYSKMIEMII